MAPDHPDALKHVSDYLGHANPGITAAEIQAALTELCQ
jgi:hypothetical protein